MLAYSVTSSGLFPRMLLALLPLVTSRNVSIWDNPVCTEREVSVDRGDLVVMACNISSTFREVSIELTANEKNRTIFNQMPPGNYSKASWQLQVQGGQARLVITNAQGIHAGQYWWKLRGRQKSFKTFTLNIIVPDTDNQEPESLQVHAESPAAERTDVIVLTVITVTVTVIVITGISVFAWCKHRHSLKFVTYKFESLV